MIVHSPIPPAPACHCGDAITAANESPLSGTCAECLDWCLCSQCREARYDIAQDRHEQLAFDAWRESRG